MTHRRAEKLSTHAITVSIKDGVYSAICTCDCQGTMDTLVGMARTESVALDRVVQGVYVQHCKIVDVRDKHACVKCGSKRILEHDHIRSRGQGGDNSVGNLRLLCHDCHEKRHRAPHIWSPESLSRG